MPWYCDEYVRLESNAGRDNIRGAHPDSGQQDRQGRGGGRGRDQTRVRLTGTDHWQGKEGTVASPYSQLRLSPTRILRIFV